MKISGRNQLKGKVRALQTDTMMAKVTVDVGGGQSVTAVITRDAVEDLGLSIGDEVVALIKATSVMLIR